MTKFNQPSFSSPANGKKFRDNFDRAFGRLCEYKGESGWCNELKFEGHNMCLKHLIELGKMKIKEGG